MLMNMVKNSLNLSKKEQSPELAEVFQNKTRPAITLSVDDKHVEDKTKEKQTEKEEGQELAEQELAEVFQSFTMQNHLIDLAVAGKKDQVDGKEKPAELPTGSDVDKASESKEDVVPDTLEENQKAKSGKITGWLRASLGLATQIVKEAQPSLNASATPKDTEKSPDSKEVSKESLHVAGSSLRKVDSTIEDEPKSIQTSDESDVLDGRVPDEKVEEQDAEDEKAEAVQNVEEHDAKEKVEVVDDSELPAESLTLAEKAAADSIAEGVEKTRNAVSTGTKTFGAKVRDLNKDGKLANVVTTAAILGAGIGAAVLGSKGGVEPEETEVEVF